MRKAKISFFGLLHRVLKWGWESKRLPSRMELWNDWRNAREGYTRKAMYGTRGKVYEPGPKMKRAAREEVERLAREGELKFGKDGSVATLGPVKMRAVCKGFTVKRANGDVEYYDGDGNRLEAPA